ncbi:putative leader peptide [Parafrankia sp. FMc6]
MPTPLMLVRREYIDLLRVTSAACTGGRPLG